MENLLYIILAVKENEVIQHFLIAFLGSVLFDTYLYFNDDIGRSYNKRKEESPHKTILYVIFKSINQAILGGVVAIGVDHSNGVSFVVGFISSSLIGFLVKLLQRNSTKQAFWIAFGKMAYIIIGSPLKKLSDILEVLNSKDKD